MGMKCQVCDHRSKKDIEKSLLYGYSKASISRQYNVPISSLLNHERNHVSRQMVTTVSIQERLSAEKLMDDVEMMLTKTKKLMESSEVAGQAFIQIQATKTLCQILNMLGSWRIEHQKMQMQQDVIDQHSVVQMPVFDSVSIQEAEKLYKNFVLGMKASPGATVVSNDEPIDEYKPIEELAENYPEQQPTRKRTRLPPGQKVTEPEVEDEDEAEIKRLEEAMNYEAPKREPARPTGPSRIWGK
jgi:hypothetical protein